MECILSNSININFLIGDNSIMVMSANVIILGRHLMKYLGMKYYDICNLPSLFYYHYTEKEQLWQMLVSGECELIQAFIVFSHFCIG